MQTESDCLLSGCQQVPHDLCKNTKVTTWRLTNLKCSSTYLRKSKIILPLHTFLNPNTFTTSTRALRNEVWCEAEGMKRCEISAPPAVVEGTRSEIHP